MQAAKHASLNGAAALVFLDGSLLATELFAQGLLLAELVLVQVTVALEFGQETPVAFLPPFLLRVVSENGVRYIESVAVNGVGGEGEWGGG